MAAEDALFRVLQPAAEARLDRLLSTGERVDVPRVVEQTLQEFQHSIKLDGFAEPLRARLTRSVEEQLGRRLAENM